jgi:hypothetical protein
MLLETGELSGTKSNRVGAQLRVRMLGPLGRAFSGGEDLPCQFGSNVGSPRLRGQGRFLAEVTVSPRFPPICFSFKWSNWVKCSWFIGEIFNSMAFMVVFTRNLRKTSSREDEAQIPVKQWPGLKNAAGFARWVL